MRKIAAAIVLCTLSATACAATRPASPKELSAIRASLQEQLFDADSAKFMHVQVNADQTIACGLVNAKNRYGAYVGFRPFMVIVMEMPGTAPVVTAPGVEEEGQTAVRETCAEREIPLP